MNTFDVMNIISYKINIIRFTVDAVVVTTLLVITVNNVTQDTMIANGYLGMRQMQMNAKVHKNYN